MKAFFYGVILYLTTTGSFAQIDTTAGAYFPHSVGNAWQFSFQGGDTGTTTITRDSVGGTSTFLFYDGDSIPAYSIDSTFDVTHYPTVPQWRTLRYRLTAPPLQWWVVQTWDTVTGIAARVDSVFWGSLFGVPTQIKAIGFYYAQRVGDTVFHSWRNEEYLAAGFGYFLSFYDPPWTPYAQLVGCIIDGRRYGTLVSVNERSQSSNMQSSHRLNPCFPNPFNSSTNISYYLSEDGNVCVSVYDLLGRTIATLVNEHQGAGSHSVSFDAQGLSSGVYFVRFTVRNFTATTTLVHSK